MRAPDGGLCATVQRRLREGWHWQRVEIAATGLGVPDLNGCRDGTEVWIEAKHTDAWAVRFQLGQSAWLGRRWRAGGRAWLLVRRTTSTADELVLHRGCDAILVEREGLRSVPAVRTWEGGPRRWDWGELERLLLGRER